MIQRLKPNTVCFVFASLVAIWACPALAQDGSRFFHNGDGRLHLISVKNGRVFKGQYRQGASQYLPEALKEIQAVFDAPVDEPLAAVSLRLVAFLDFLQDRLKPGAAIRISSGWRSPEYNTDLRKAGRLAATASLHQYGMAADIEIEGVSSRKVWKYIRQLNFGGAGYYHGQLVHVDVGPARYWDETSSGVGTGISDDNKLIGLVTDFDRYLPGDPVVMRFIRMTAFPIGVAPKMALRSLSDGDERPISIDFRPLFSKAMDDKCPKFDAIGQMLNIRWHMPKELPAGRYQIEANFCECTWPDMPHKTSTPIFEVRAIPDKQHP